MSRHEPMSGYTLLSDRPGDISKVRQVLADWGLDRVTIDRVLEDRQMYEATHGKRKNERHSMNEGWVERQSVAC